VFSIAPEGGVGFLYAAAGTAIACLPLTLAFLAVTGTRFSLLLTPALITLGVRFDLNGLAIHLHLLGDQGFFSADAARSAHDLNLARFIKVDVAKLFFRPHIDQLSFAFLRAEFTDDEGPIMPAKLCLTRSHQRPLDLLWLPLLRLTTLHFLLRLDVDHAATRTDLRSDEHTSVVDRSSATTHHHLVPFAEVQARKTIFGPQQHAGGTTVVGADSTQDKRLVMTTHVGPVQALQFSLDAGRTLSRLTPLHVRLLASALRFGLTFLTLLPSKLKIVGVDRFDGFKATVTVVVDTDADPAGRLHFQFRTLLLPVLLLPVLLLPVLLLLVLLLLVLLLLVLLLPVLLLPVLLLPVLLLLVLLLCENGHGKPAGKQAAQQASLEAI